MSYDDRLLLKALISNSPVPIRAVELPPGARGHVRPGTDAILVKKGMDAPDIFRCVSSGACQCPACPQQRKYSRETEGYKAYAVSYMLCQRYGVEAGGYNISRLDGVLQGQSPRRKSRQPSPICATRLRRSTGAWQGPWASHAFAGRQKEQER